MQTADSTQPISRRGSVWRWIFGVVAACFVFAGVAVFNLVTLTREATVLRNEVFAALDVSARTRIQLSVGPVALTALRTGLSFVDRVPREVRLAFDAVRSASVGVYELRGKVGAHERANLFAATDKKMSRRGWTRVVGVNDARDTVLIYMPTEENGGGAQRICLVVCDRDQIVVVDATAKPEPLIELAGLRRGLASL